MKKRKGTGGAEGKAAGTILVLNNLAFEARAEKSEDAEYEISRFETVRKEYKEELKQLYREAEISAGEEPANIFLAYIEMVNDDAFFGKIIRRIQNEKLNLVYVLEEEKKAAAVIFQSMDDPYMRERGTDIENVCDALIRKMEGLNSPMDEVSKTKEDIVIVAADLMPEDIMRMDTTHVKGFVTERGGNTSHTVILAKALGIPAVVGVKNILEEAGSKTNIYMDGGEGTIILEPDQEVSDIL